jgi:dynein heavy chain
LLRVLLFQDRFDELVSLMDRFQDGERLFNTPVTTYPSLNENKRIFSLLKKLYDLYNLVNSSIEKWSIIPWNRLKIDDIIDNLVDYSNKCRKLPSGVKDWPAFNELKNNIEEWSEKMILVEMMFKNGLKERHWNMIEKLTDTNFPVGEANFVLIDVIKAPLLENKVEIEDICQTAVKEVDIETKLRQIIFEWSTIKAELSQFKTRGLLIVKGQELAEVVATLEESQMIMSSLASNR